MAASFTPTPTVDSDLTNVNNIKGHRKALKDSFDKTDLDLENKSTLGGPNNDFKTEYPATTTGTPANSANPGAPTRFVHTYTSTNTYLDHINGLVVNNSKLSSDPNSPLALKLTSFDVSEQGIAVPDSTVYPPSTGPTPIPSLGPNQNGINAEKYTQKYSPSNTYLNSIPFTEAPGK